MSALPICYCGSAKALPIRRHLRAGPLTLDYENGDLRYIRLGDREIIRRWYVAVRDSNWGTVPAWLSGETIEAGAEDFRIAYQVEHRQGDIDFAWNGSISGTADGTITFRMDGLARTTFQRNRLGFCVLHPIRECAGALCRYELENGIAGKGSFPGLVDPHNPFRDLRAFAHEITPGVWAELRFDGDLFEMEDQRNWTDASFKTFCTPLRLPFPVTVEAGSRICQTITLRLVGLLDHPVSPPSSNSSLVIEPVVLGTLPQIGLGANEEHRPLTPRELERLRMMRPAHLRVDLDLAIADYPRHLRLEASHAAALGIPLEIAVTLSDHAEQELAGFVETLRELSPSIGRVLLFHGKEWSTTAPWIVCARAALAKIIPGVPIFSGTTANFRELNGARPPVNLLDGVCYSVHPQVHAFDNSSLVETCAALPDTVRTARSFCGDLPLAVTPITLRERFNPYATGPAAPVSPGQLPPRVDPRQMSLFAVGWTLGSLKYLSESGVECLTYFETIGWRGVMETEAGSPLPELFPSRPGMVFPLFHVLADAAEFAGNRVLRTRSSCPLRCEGLTLRSATTTRVLLANLVEAATPISIIGLGTRACVRILDESTFGDASRDPEMFRASPGSEWEVTGGRLDLTLRPFAYARIESE
jgi:hypothetical protein